MSAEWDKGWQDGYAFALKYFDQVKGYLVDLPANFKHRGDSWSRGFAEGEIYGHGQVHDKHFKIPGKTLICIYRNKGKYEAKYK
jgi:hypothetical protein